ncbi:hypothetical protein SAY87_018667 [Trapa incisa]|uniref:glucan endo-1,3-beta-D-glucosidase n=1 Tax=Trapa incisa TaxID=236973 RepID=A0AAN7Q0N0_9MYRT|nr:hypothetical protein SAY87_018667 [Trapa incisa]
MLGDNLPPVNDVINLYKQYNIQRMRLYSPNHDAFRALGGSNIEVLVDVNNDDLKSLASSQDQANTWVQNNIQNYGNVNFKYIAVGNEITASSNIAQYLVPAMRNIQTAINNAGLGGKIKVSTSITYAMIGVSYPPSAGAFSNAEAAVIDPILRFLLDNQAPLLINIYPYFAYRDNQASIGLDYSLFTSNSVVVSDGSYGYKNLFDAQLDAAYAALETNNATSLRIHAQIGVCYGLLGNNLPSPQDVINMYKQYNIPRMRLYGPDQASLQALRGSNIEVMIGVPDENLERLASSQAEAYTWVRNNVQNYGDVNFKYIAVGNEIVAANYIAQFLVPAMRNIQTAINTAGLGAKIKVSTSITFGMMGVSYPPSAGEFNNVEAPVIDPIIRFLLENQAPLLLNLYPYFPYKNNQGVDIRLDYSLFTVNTVVVQDGPYGYKNLFDSMLDSVYVALEKKNARSLRIVVSETGWPTEGDFGASIDNAKTYNNNLAQHVKGGTPRRPGGPIETYIFDMFDENQKPLGIENHWGLFNPITRAPKYPINLN